MTQELANIAEPITPETYDEIMRAEIAEYKNNVYSVIAENNGTDDELVKMLDYAPFAGSNDIETVRDLFHRMREKDELE